MSVLSVLLAIPLGFAAVMLAVGPTWLRARRRRRLAHARLEMTEAVTRIEGLMSEPEHVTGGTVLHDVVYPAMFYSQAMEPFLTLREVVAPYGKGVDKIVAMFKQEMASASEEVRGAVVPFFRACGQAVRYDRPWLYWLLAARFAVENMVGKGNGERTITRVGMLVPARAKAKTV